LQQLGAQETKLGLNFNNGFALANGQASASALSQLHELASEFPQLISQVTAPTPAKPMIEMAVELLEVKHYAARDLGIRWPGAAAGPVVSRVQRQLFQFPFELASELRLMERRGDARLLAQPNLVAQSGEAATFLAGGEIPIPQVVAQGLQDVTFREYGIRLNMTPTLRADDSIETVIQAEVSRIDGAVSVNGVPGILTRRASSTFHAQSGETLVLAGLLNHERSAAAHGLPSVLNIPVLGALMQSRDVQQQQSELIVMVTPRLVAERQQKRAWAKQVETDLNQFYQDVGCTGMQP